LIAENETRTQLTRALTRQVSLVEQELFILPEQLRSPPCFVVVGNVLLNLKIDINFNQLHYLGNVNFKQWFCKYLLLYFYYLKEGEEFKTCYLECEILKWLLLCIETSLVAFTYISVMFLVIFVRTIKRIAT
jgi:hypothetical protein